jgi:hypothetical protein
MSLTRNEQRARRDSLSPLGSVWTGVKGDTVRRHGGHSVGWALDAFLLLCC